MIRYDLLTIMHHLLKTAIIEHRLFPRVNWWRVLSTLLFFPFFLGSNCGPCFPMPLKWHLRHTWTYLLICANLLPSLCPPKSYDMPFQIFEQNTFVQVVCCLSPLQLRFHPKNVWKGAATSKCSGCSGWMMEHLSVQFQDVEWNMVTLWCLDF